MKKPMLYSAIALSVVSGIANAASNTVAQDFQKWRVAENAKQLANTSDRIIIKYKENASPAALQSFTGDINTMRATKLKKRTGKNFKHLRAMGNKRHLMKMDKFMTAAEAQAMAASDSEIESVELDAIRYPLSQFTPWGLAPVQADQLSDAAASNMKVCVIDSGYDHTNPDLAARSSSNVNGTNDSGTGNWYQAGGSHGTHVAGTIAAINNDEGVEGVLPNGQVNLHIVRVFNESGWGYSSDLADAVQTCADNGAKVVNMSLGGPSATNSERNALQSIADSGVLLIAAAGNDGNSDHSYPASYDSVMSVGATDSNNQHAEFSQFTNQVEISAPGVSVLSTVAGDGRLSSIEFGGKTLGMLDDSSHDANIAAGDGDTVVSHTRLTGSDYSTLSDINATVTGELAVCGHSGSSYSCGNMTGKICVAERYANVADNSGSAEAYYPEITPARACSDAGAAGIIIYSNSDKPGLQNPFLLDASSEISVPYVTVDRANGLELANAAGTSATLTVKGNTEYAYYNGTSMASPHVAGVAALVWSNNISCTAAQVRQALTATALDLGTSGRDDYYGYGLVQAKAASDYLASNCGGTPPVTGNELQKGVAETGLSGDSRGDTIEYTIEVPEGATDLTVDLSGSNGDADLYVNFGAVATSSNADASGTSGNSNESVTIASPSAGTYHITVYTYSAYSGASLVADYTAADTTTPGTGDSKTFTDLGQDRGGWLTTDFEIPAGISQLTVTITGGTGDADLYLNYGSSASAAGSSATCVSENSANEEICTINNPTEGTWYLGMYAYRTFSGATLTYTYE